MGFWIKWQEGTGGEFPHEWCVRECERAVGGRGYAVGVSASSRVSGRRGREKMTGVKLESEILFFVYFCFVLQ